jgi:hypothetical protein
MSQDEIERLFARWWAESYGSIPGPHARMTHAAFAKWFAEHGQEPEAA